MFLHVRMRFAATLAFILCCGPTFANAVDDANNILVELNPLTAEISSLIGQAKDAGNTVLQQRLEQFNGIIQLAIDRANEVVKMRVQDIDKRITAQMRALNSYVATDIMQMQAVAHASLKQADAILSKNSDRFTGGIGNAICSVDFLTTLPVLQVPNTGITTYAQQGSITRLFVPGSCLAKGDVPPKATLIVPGDKSGRPIELPTVASLGLLTIDIPNKFIPLVLEPTNFVLHLSFVKGQRLWVLWNLYSEQDIPIHICGEVPILHARFVAKSSGKAVERKTVHHPDMPFEKGGIYWDHLTSNKGSNNTKKDYKVPDASPEAGWDIDRSPNDYGLTYANIGSAAHWEITKPSPGVVRLYTDGSDGDAFLNGSVSVKLIRYLSKKPCVPGIEWDQPLPYGPKSEIDISQHVTQSIGDDCEAARSVAAPTTEIQVTVMDQAGHAYGSRYLRPNVPSDFIGDEVEITMDENGHVALEATPSCKQQALPREEPGRGAI